MMKCLFCKKQAVPFLSENSSFQVECMNCGATGPLAETEEEAVAKYNKLGELQAEHDSWKRVAGHLEQRVKKLRMLGGRIHAKLEKVCPCSHEARKWEEEVP